MTDGRSSDIRDLTPAQRAVLARRLLRERREESAMAIRRRDDHRGPLSFGQERLWLVERIAPGTAAYHFIDVLALEGDPDCDALRRSLEELLRRHASLRTTFSLDEGMPIQSIAPPATVDLSVEEWSGRATEPLTATASALVGEEQTRLFDLERGPHAQREGRPARPSATGVDRDRKGSAPGDAPTQLLLAELWKEVLGVEDVGLYDDFFQLGGHSLLVTQLLSRLRDALGAELPVRTVFEAPTLAQLDTEIAQRLAPDGEAEAEQQALSRMIEEIRSLSEAEIDAFLGDRSQDP